MPSPQLTTRARVNRSEVCDSRTYRDSTGRYELVEVRCHYERRRYWLALAYLSDSGSRWLHRKSRHRTKQAAVKRIAAWERERRE